MTRMARRSGLRSPGRSGNVARYGNQPVTMSLNRRNFIAGSAAIASTPALGAASGEVDVAIVGAGAAGIAAARKVAAAGRRYVLLEAGDRIGGRGPGAAGALRGAGG